MKARKVEVKEVDYNPEFIARMIPKIDWPALRQATQQVSTCTRLACTQTSDTTSKYMYQTGLLSDKLHTTQQVSAMLTTIILSPEPACICLSTLSNIFVVYCIVISYPPCVWVGIVNLILTIPGLSILLFPGTPWSG